MHLPPFAPHMIFNVGSNNPIALLDFISNLEIELDEKAKRNSFPFNQGMWRKLGLLLKV